MCVNYVPQKKEILISHFEAPLADGYDDTDWKEETWQDYTAPIIRHNLHGQRESVLAAYSMVPKDKMPAGMKRFSTMNARAETVAQLRSYAQPWHDGNLCLVPMQCFFEPNYESGKAERWRISLKQAAHFAVAGLYQVWPDANRPSFSFTQLTINADQHSLMKRFHPAGEEKRSLVILHEAHFDAWLSCRQPEQAQQFLQLYPADWMQAEAAPLPRKAAAPKPQQDIENQSLQGDLFA